MLYLLISPSGYCAAYAKDVLEKARKKTYATDTRIIECNSIDEAISLLCRYAEERDYIPPKKLSVQTIYPWQPANSPKKFVVVDTENGVSYWINPNGQITFLPKKDRLNRQQTYHYVNDTSMFDENDPAIRKQLATVGYVLYYDFKKEKYTYVYLKNTKTTVIKSAVKPSDTPLLFFEN